MHSTPPGHLDPICPKWATSFHRNLVRCTDVRDVASGTLLDTRYWERDSYSWCNERFCDRSHAHEKWYYPGVGSAGSREQVVQGSRSSKVASGLR